MHYIPATEIRCQEKSKGGLSYEVVLSKNGVSNVIVPKRPAVLDKNISSQEIDRKLRAAEERRLVSSRHTIISNGFLTAI